MESRFATLWGSHSSTLCPDRCCSTVATPIKFGLSRWRFWGVGAALLGCLASALAGDTIQFAEGELGGRMTSESVGEFSITLVRQGNNDHTLFVTYEVVAGTATAGTDFVAAGSTLKWPAGQSRKTITVPILNDAEAEPVALLLVLLSVSLKVFP